MSCAKQAVATMVGISVAARLSIRLLLAKYSATKLAIERPTLATSKLWVNLLCTKISPGRETPVFYFVVYEIRARKLACRSLVETANENQMQLFDDCHQND